MPRRLQDHISDIVESIGGMADFNEVTMSDTVGYQYPVITDQEIDSGDYELVSFTEVARLRRRGLIDEAEVRVSPDQDCCFINRGIIEARINNVATAPNRATRTTAANRVIGAYSGVGVSRLEATFSNPFVIPEGGTNYSNEDIEAEDDPFDNDSGSDEDYDSEDGIPRWKTITPDDFHGYEIQPWTSEIEREQVTDLYFKQIEYRLRWIFSREEKEGFRRRSYGVKPFSRQDFLEKVAKRGVEHELNTSSSAFYDWNIGATDFILRLESFVINGIDAMRVHFIYKVNRMEIGYQDRIWDGSQYQQVAQQWAEIE